MNIKLIREARIGPPKAFKTGAVVGSYPKPMAYFQFDRGGIDIVPPKNHSYGNGEIKMDTCYEEVSFVTPGRMADALAVSTQPKITVFDYAGLIPLELSTDFTPSKSSASLDAFQNPASGDWNTLVNHYRRNQSIPFKTLVFDSMTGYSHIVLNHMSSFNPGAMNDARVWASLAGGKVRQLVLAATGMPAHVVFIFHTIPPEADDVTKQLQELPNVYSKLKGDLGGLFSQYFYATRQGNKPIIAAMDYLYVKGVGMRWPAGLPATVGPTFQDIYGKELQS